MVHPWMGFVEIRCNGIRGHEKSRDDVTMGMASGWKAWDGMGWDALGGIGRCECVRMEMGRTVMRCGTVSDWIAWDRMLTQKVGCGGVAYTRVDRSGIEWDVVGGKGGDGAGRVPIPPLPYRIFRSDGRLMARAWHVKYVAPPLVPRPPSRPMRLHRTHDQLHPHQSTPHHTKPSHATPPQPRLGVRFLPSTPPSPLLSFVGSNAATVGK